MSSLPWTHRVDNARAVPDLFGEAPSLANVELHEVSLHRDGPSMTLRFEPLEQPLAAGPRNENATQITLMLLGLVTCTVSGFASQSFADIELDYIGGRFLCTVLGTTSARIECRGALVQRVWRYTRADPRS